MNKEEHNSCNCDTKDEESRYADRCSELLAENIQLQEKLEASNHDYTELMKERADYVAENKRQADLLVLAKEQMDAQATENKLLKEIVQKRVKWILLQVGSVDDSGDYWGHDTNLGNIDEFVAEIAQALKETK